MARALSAVGDRWTLLVLRESFLRTRRFADFQSRLGVARNTVPKPDPLQHARAAIGDRRRPAIEFRRHDRGGVGAVDDGNRQPGTGERAAEAVG